MKTYYLKPSRVYLLTLLALGLSLITPAAQADNNEKKNSNEVIHYRTVEVDGLTIFYREAGNPKKPSLLLLHGFPTSSHMFRNLLPALAEKYHLIAPDYPGFGQSSMPAREAYDYTFENITTTIEHFTQAIDLQEYSLYMMDYGAPVGFRLALRHPQRVKSLIIQNGNAYEVGLGDFWDPIRQLWKNNSTANRDALRPFLELSGTMYQYTHGVDDVTLVSPDNWIIDQYLLDRPGNKDIQLDLFYDYRTNVAQYPQWHEYLRTYQPPTLVVWGKNDDIFTVEGANAFKDDLNNLDFHLLNAGHFALESRGKEIIKLMKAFLKRNIEDD